LAYAERLHSGQRRSVDGAPFILHPAEVAASSFTRALLTT
jgi:(p)ppGpp synthase/HD superfamily hydrolase